MDSDYNVVKTWFGRTVIRSSYKLFYEVKYVRSIFMIGSAWSKICFVFLQFFFSITNKKIKTKIVFQVA